MTTNTTPNADIIAATTADFDAQEARARSALAAVQADIDRAALAGNTKRLEELEQERNELTTQVERTQAARRAAARAAAEEAAIDRTEAASKAATNVKKLLIDRQAAVLNLGAAIEALRLEASGVDQIDIALRDEMLMAVRANVSDKELRLRLAGGRTVGGDTVTPVLAALHAATRAAVFNRRVEIGGFTTPTTDLGIAAARDTELAVGWLESLGRYRAIEEAAQ